MRQDASDIQSICNIAPKNAEFNIIMSKQKTNTN